MVRLERPRCSALHKKEKEKKKEEEKKSLLKKSEVHSLPVAKTTTTRVYLLFPPNIMSLEDADELLFTSVRRAGMCVIS